MDWNDKERLLTFTDKIVLNEDDLFKSYTTWVNKHNEMLVQIKSMQKEVSDLEERILTTKPYYDKIKERVLTRMAMRHQKKRGVG